MVNNFIMPQFWVPANGLELEDNALQVVKSDFNSIVIAGPGAGKTELLAQRACFLLQTNSCPRPRKILAISFKKDAAENLADRVELRCGKELASRFVSETYDAFAKGLLDRFIRALPDKYRPNHEYEIAQQDRLRNDVRKAFQLAGLTDRNVINDTLNKLLTQHKLPLPNDTHLIVKNAWGILLKGTEETDSHLTFQMISRLAEYLIRENPIIKNSLLSTYSHVFLDEFQDTTEVQYELVKTCFFQSDTLITAVGDNKQRIMLWAGAKKDVFEQFEQSFNAKSIRLTMNHRSAPRLVEIQKHLYKALEEPYTEIKTNVKWEQNEGQAFIWEFSTYTEEASAIAVEVNRLISEEGVKARDICIIVKQLVDEYAVDVIKELKKLGIKARNEGLYQDFLKEECIRLCINVLLLALGKKSADCWIDTIEMLLQVRGIDSSEMFAEISESEEEFKFFLSTIKTKLSKVDEEQDLFDILWDVIKFFNLEALKSIFVQYKAGNRVQDLIKTLSSYLWLEYNECKNWLKAVENLNGVECIPIMTIHKSKGLEYDTVIFLGLEDAAFWNFVRQKEEDTCAFFVALSRAKKRIIFTFSRKRILRNRLSNQSRGVINELYEILKNSGIVEEVLI